MTDSDTPELFPFATIVTCTLALRIYNNVCRYIKTLRVHYKTAGLQLVCNSNTDLYTASKRDHSFYLEH